MKHSNHEEIIDTNQKEQIKQETNNPAMNPGNQLLTEEILTFEEIVDFEMHEVQKPHKTLYEVEPTTEGLNTNFENKLLQKPVSEIPSIAIQESTLTEQNPILHTKKTPNTASENKPINKIIGESVQIKVKNEAHTIENNKTYQKTSVSNTKLANNQNHENIAKNIQALEVSPPDKQILTVDKIVDDNADQTKKSAMTQRAIENILEKAPTFNSDNTIKNPSQSFSSGDEQETVQEALAVEEVVNFEMHKIQKPNNAAEETNTLAPIISTQKSRIFNWLNALILGVLTLLLIGLYQLIQTVMQAWHTNPVLGGLLGGMALGFVILLTVLITKEIQGYRRIKVIDSQLNKLNIIYGSQNRADWLEFYRTNQQVQTSPLAQTCHQHFFQNVKPHHSAEELQDMYQCQVIDPLQNNARSSIKKDMLASAAISGLSPNAFFQTMALVWLHLKMVRNIADIYGFRPGMLGQIKLLKMAFNSMIILSIADVATETLITDVFGTGLISKISTQSAEALISARLTHRLGEGFLAAITFKKPK
jgi:putative membrane protein